MPRYPESYYSIAEIIGEEAARKLCEVYGGDTLYLPKPESLDAVDKAGRLLVQLQRSGVYKNRWKDERKKTIEALREGMLLELRASIQEDEELLERLTAIVEGVARREAAKE